MLSDNLMVENKVYIPQDPEKKLFHYISVNESDKAIALIKILDQSVIDANGNRTKTTPLILASQKGLVEIVRSLLMRNAKINEIDIFGSTALDVAKDKLWSFERKADSENPMFKNYREIVELLETVSGK